jgi:hypothetical protein
MMIQNIKRWSKFSPIESLMGTLALTLLAFLIRYSLSVIIQPFAVFHFFILSCLATQYFFGYKYAFLGVLISVLAGEYFFVEPIGTFDQLLTKDIIISLNFIMVTGAAILLMEILQRGIYARELMLKVGDSRHLLSLQRENDRLFYAQKSSEAWIILELLIKDFDRIILVQYGQDPPRLEPLFHRLTGFPPDRIQTSHWMESIHPEDRGPLTTLLDPASKSKRNSPTTLTLRFAQSGNFFQHPIAVHLNRFEFMGEPLILLMKV